MTAFSVIIVTALLMCAGLVLDGGLGLSSKVQAIDEAQEAARAGAQELDLTAYRATGSVRLVPDQAANAVRTYLAGSGYSSTVTVAGNQVTVNVTRDSPTQLFGLVGIRSLHITGTATAQALHGIDGPA